MKLEFETILTGEDIELDFKTPESKEIIKQECTIKWYIDIISDKRGVKFWNIVMTNFRVNITLDYEEELDGIDEGIEYVVFDDQNEYQLEIDSEEYKMKWDFIITKIQLDRFNKTAKAFINS